MPSYPTTDPAALLTETDAARLLSLSTRTLQAWRVKSVGPPFVRLGRAIRYSRAALIDWATSNMVDPSSERASNQ